MFPTKLPGREKLVEAAAWFSILPDKVVEAGQLEIVHTPSHCTPTSRVLGSDWVDSAVVDASPSPPGTELILRTCPSTIVSIQRQVPESGLVRAPDPNTLLLLQLMGRIEQLEVEAKVTKDEPDRRRLADLTAADARDAGLTAQILEVRDSARVDILRMAEMGERNRKAASAMERLMEAHQTFLDAQAKLIVDREWLNSIPNGQNLAGERRQVTVHIKVDESALDRGRQRLRQARDDYAHAAAEAGVDAGATLAVYNE